MLLALVMLGHHRAASGSEDVLDAHHPVLHHLSRGGEGWGGVGGGGGGGEGRGVV
jgi:hypothetical protein